MQGPTARLFVALWPPPQTRNALLAHQAAWTWPAGARLTRPERLHITLHFIGAVPDARMDELRQGLLAPIEPFDLEFATAELWRGGLAVLCADRVAPRLSALHAELRQRLVSLGLPVEERPLRVHVTLARDAQGARPPAAPAPVHWPAADGYALVQSLPGGQGYRTIQRFA